MLLCNKEIKTKKKKSIVFLSHSMILGKPQTLGKSAIEMMELIATGTVKGNIYCDDSVSVAILHTS